MKFWRDNSAAQSRMSFSILWWIPAIFPLLIVLSAFMTGTWSWGLMDDYNMLTVKGTVGERFVTLFKDLFGAGRFYPTFLLHSALFYKVFYDNPLGFFLLRWVEVSLGLSVWGLLAYEVTQKKIAIPLCIAIGLSFSRFYDAFFFLSTQEILGLLFCGAGALYLFKSLKPQIDQVHQIKVGYLILGSIFLLFGFASKEPFISVGIALGFSLMIISFKDKGLRSVFFVGLVLLLFSLCYGLALKLFVAKGYSASYSLSWDKLGGNLEEWFTKVVAGHLPWIVVGSLFLFFRPSSKNKSKIYLWGKSFGVLTYLSYLLLILPWSGWGHYVTPLAVFFAFTLTVFIVNKLEAQRTWVMGLIILISLSFNLYVGGKATYFHASYQSDTAQLLKWLSKNALFEHDVMSKGVTVRCNAQEPCVAIRNFLDMQYDKVYPRFYFTSKVKEVVEDIRTKYYIWSPFWGDQDLARLGNMWTPMLQSEHWVVFRRMY